MRIHAPRSGSKSRRFRRCSSSRMGSWSTAWSARSPDLRSRLSSRAGRDVTSLTVRWAWPRFLQVRLQVLHDRPEGFRGLGVRMLEDERFARIATDDDPRVQGDATQEREAELLRRRFAPADLEDVRLLAAMRADESAHVLDDAEDVHLHSLGEGDRLADI